jgi:hypothetical protein
MIENNYESIYKHIEDTLKHKQFFLQSCMMMVNYLYAQKRYDDAIELAKRGSAHDHSKFELDEIKHFIQMPLCQCKTNKPNGILTNEQKQLIAIHWKRNRHHPEFFADYHRMDEIDIMEMVCDWHARSMQYETDFMEFVLTIPRERFGFDEDFFSHVLLYCDILNQSDEMLK